MPAHEQTVRVADDAEVEAERDAEQVGPDRRDDDRRGEEEADDAELAEEVVDPPQRPREVQRQRVEPQVPADEVRPDDEHEEQRADELGLEEVRVRDRPDGRAVVLRLGDHLRREDALEERDDRLGLLFEEAPQGERRDEGEGRQPRHEQQEPDEPALEQGPDAVPGDGEPPPAVAGEFALPVLVALVEDRHGYFPTASRNTSSSELRCGRR